MSKGERIDALEISLAKADERILKLETRLATLEVRIRETETGTEAEKKKAADGGETAGKAARTARRKTAGKQE